MCVIYIHKNDIKLSSISECVKKYLEDEESEHPEFTKNVMDDFPDEPAYKKCRTTLNSAAKLESLVLIIFKLIHDFLNLLSNSFDQIQVLTIIMIIACCNYKAGAAKWEPPHGRFRHFFYPWSEYVKVGAVLRYCAYEVMALHGVLHSEIQVFLPLPVHASKLVQNRMCIFIYIQS